MKMASSQHVSIAANRKGRRRSPSVGFASVSLIRKYQKDWRRCCVASVRVFFWLLRPSFGCSGDGCMAVRDAFHFHMGSLFTVIITFFPIVIPQGGQG